LAEILEIDGEGDGKKSPEMSEKEKKLISWVMGRVSAWEEYRDSNFKDKWDEYYRLWRGIWSASDKTRESERSRLISPALQQAIEAAVADVEEATFGKGRWFDVSDDLADPVKNDVMIFRDLMHEDMNQSGVPAAMSEIFLLSAIYGTGIGKIVVEEVLDKTIQAVPVGGTYEVMEASVSEVPKVSVNLVPVEPSSFAIDPSATSVDNALGCAHVMGNIPRHTVAEKQTRGIYKQYDVGSYPDDEDVTAKGETKPSVNNDAVKIVEYHGLIPAYFLEDEEENGVDDLVDSEGIYNPSEYDMVEAIVTIANDGVLLKAVRNPYKMQDRCIVAFSWDTVPGRFWGRGVSEKGYNPQKALDAEVRGRMDAMALAIHPMMAIDATRIPRGGDTSVRPGRTILTNGDPRTVLMPFNFGQVGTNTFAASGEFERMVQMGTGAMDSAAPIGVSPRNSTASGMSMMLGGAIKRSKRTLANIERQFTTPLVHKTAWRYMQFAPDRYPVTDVHFVVQGTLGIMAREVEQQQLSSLLSTVPSESPAFWMLIRSIYDNSSINNKQQMLDIIDNMLKKILNPEPPQPSFEDQRKMQELQIKAQTEQARIQVELLRARSEMARVTLEAQKAASQEAKTEAETILTLAKAQATSLESDLSKLKAVTDALQAESERKQNDQRAVEGFGESFGDVPVRGMENFS